MKKFKVTVERTDTYEVEIDEKVIDKEFIDKEFIDNFKRYFYDIDSLQEHAENIAKMRARHHDNFIEGYGYLLVNDDKPWNVKDENVNKSINIKTVDEDYDVEAYSKEI